VNVGIKIRALLVDELESNTVSEGKQSKKNEEESRMEGYFQKIVVYATIVIIAAFLTLCTFDTWQTVLLVALLLIIVNYVIILSMDKLTTLDVSTISEGFVTESDAAASKYVWLGNDELFDDFYASVFTNVWRNFRKDSPKIT
jgi:hypothetical protein